MIHETRVIPLDARAHINENIRPYAGSGRGHWEGGTLVVKSTNLTDRTGVGVGGAHSAGLKLVETYTRVDPEMIRYTATIDDSAMFTAPFTDRVMFATTPGYQMYEYSCHEGNGARNRKACGTDVASFGAW